MSTISGLMIFFASFAVLCELCAKGIRSSKERYVGAKLAKDRKARKADVIPMTWIPPLKASLRISTMLE